MKFSAAVVLSAAAGAMAGFARSNVTYVTEVVSEYVTYCPEPTTITHGDHTYTVTEVRWEHQERNCEGGIMFALRMRMSDWHARLARLSIFATSATYPFPLA